jgi:transcriptional regulator with XRE-family HTH domain
MAANDIPSTAMGEVPGFAADLASRREQRGLTMTSLAEQMGFDRSYVSHVEHGRHPASADFARRADAALSAGGALWRSWQQDVDRPGSAGVQVTRVNTTGLLVEDDHAELRYADGFYRATQRRQLFNAGTEPVTRYLMRISVDRCPGDPERSNRLYRERPLRLDQLGLTATCDGEEMARQVKFDRDAFKEIWLLFENARGKFPLYPGQRATLAYSYAVDDGRWGPWFQRAVRLPTGHLSVRLVFPSEARPAVWGTETSTTAEAVPLRTPIAHHRDGTTDAYEWSTDDPPMRPLPTRMAFPCRRDRRRGFGPGPAHQQRPDARRRHRPTRRSGAPPDRRPVRPASRGRPRPRGDRRTVRRDPTGQRTPRLR